MNGRESSSLAIARALKKPVPGDVQSRFLLEIIGLIFFGRTRITEFWVIFF